MAIAMVIALFGCNSEKKGGYAEQADTISVSADSTSAEKIIKTADIRFRVKDAQKTKTEISAQLKQYGGALVESNIESSVQQREKVKYSIDSLLEITSYSTEGRIIARVPSEKLDNFTDDVVKHADFVDHQSIRFDDQRINYMVNKAKAQNRVDAIKAISKKAVKKSANVESALYIKDDFADKQAENMIIDDKVKFSTITLSFYQDNTVKKVVTGNDNLWDYRPAFFRRLGLNIINGWFIFKEFILILANLWTVFIIGAGLYFGIKYYRKKRISSRS